jgi:parallel beta-helix repeat protein
MTWLGRLFGATLVSAGALCLSSCGGNGGSSPPIPPATPTVVPAYSVAVTSLNDSGTGSLRAAIAAVNSEPSGTATVITFSVNGTILLANALPAITAVVRIDGTSAPSYAGAGPVVEVNANAHGGIIFATGSSGSQLLAIAVDNAGGNGVTLNASSITLNFDSIGVNLAGTAFGNSGDGVYVSGTSSNNLIGLNPSGASGVVGNVISGNAGNGISFHASSGNVVVANRIGTNRAGTSSVANGGNGIWLTTASTGNEIGGTIYTDAATGKTNDPTGNKGTVTPVFIVPPLGNLISGNAQNGVLIDSLSINNTLNGNFIGTNASGEAAIGNGADGVSITGAGLNALIGCLVNQNPFVYYNVLSGNAGNGLHITSSNNVTVQGNFFGIDADNSMALANTGDGILIDGSSQNTQVGGVIPLGNVSAGNVKNGIEVAGTVSGFTTFNTFGGLLAFKTAVPNGNDGVLITATGGNQLVRTNVLSGNANNGLEIGGNASGVTVDPNIMGLDTIGNSLMPNDNDGLLIDGTANNNVIGGYNVSVIPQNTFSGNKAYGIAIAGQAYANRIFNSYVGTNVLGLTSLANQLGGIYVGGSATNNLIGGTSTSQTQPSKNIISGNGGYGVTLDAGTSNISVIGNYIGVDLYALSLPNVTGPILVNPGSTGDTITANLTAPI